MSLKCIASFKELNISTLEEHLSIVMDEMASLIEDISLNEIEYISKVDELSSKEEVPSLEDLTNFVRTKVNIRQKKRALNELEAIAKDIKNNITNKKKTTKIY